jgi:uncharacterized zinc-type alcohol dehydrogenase-like protein
MARHAGSCDFILDAVSAAHDLNAYLVLLKQDGTLTMGGAPPAPLPVEVFNLVFARRQLAGSLIGGIAETQEMLDFCAEHNIGSDIEMIAIQQINEAYERLLKGDVRYRFVIDMASLTRSANTRPGSEAGARPLRRAPGDSLYARQQEHAERSYRIAPGSHGEVVRRQT